MKLIRFVKEANQNCNDEFRYINPEIELCAIGTISESLINLVENSEITRSLIENEAFLPFTEQSRGDLQLRIVIID